MGAERVSIVFRRVVRLLVLAAGVAAALVSAPILAAPAQAAPAGVAQFSDITLPGGRHYLLALPPGAAHPPLILALHGGGGSPEQFAADSRLAEMGTGAGFAVAFPAGSGRTRLLTWNGGYCCSYAQRQQVDDVAFLRSVITDAAKRAGVDPARVYVTGMSNGAIMAQTLAAAAPAGTVRAVASVAGTLDLDRYRPANAIPVLHIHGTADDHVPYNGGVGPSGLTNTNFTAAEVALDAFRDRFAGPLTAETYTIDPVADGMHTERTDWRTADGRLIAALMKVVGGGHAWPGGPRGARKGATRDFDASREVLTFFIQVDRQGR
jgi:polyhydroxybutyrate depolymerase